MDMGERTRNPIRILKSQNIGREMPFVDRRFAGLLYAFLGERGGLPSSSMIVMMRTAVILSLCMRLYLKLSSRISLTHMDTHTSFFIAKPLPICHSSLQTHTPLDEADHLQYRKLQLLSGADGVMWTVSVRVYPEKPWHLSQPAPTHTLHCLQPYCFYSDNFINKLIGHDQVLL